MSEPKGERESAADILSVAKDLNRDRERVKSRNGMAENFDEIVSGVVRLVDEHTSDPNLQAPTAADWKLIDEVALLPEAELIET